MQIVIVALESTSAVFHNIQTLPLKQKLELHQVKRKKYVMKGWIFFSLIT